MGFDKSENEEVLKHAWEGDIWFHVDKHSSAHVYVRTLNFYNIDTLPKKIIIEAA